MSENIPSTSSANVFSPSSPSPPSPPPSQHHKKSRRKFDKSRLPTPPPDPIEIRNNDDREDFLAYLDSLQKSNTVPYSRSTSVFAPVVATEDAFEHLEKLYKLMEQMLELREQNARLHRKVRDLEHFNNLEKMHRQLDAAMVDRDCPELDKDTAFAETILESILSETKVSKQKQTASSRLRESISRRQRNRGGSVSVTGLEQDQIKSGRRASTCVDSRTNNKPSKVSKWTKVKAAFKWEKASPTVSDAKSLDSGIGGMVPVNLEVARYLRVPSTSEDGAGHSPADSGAAEISTPGTLSTASSTEDFHRHDLRSPCEDIRSSDDERPHNYIPRFKDGSHKSSKIHKTPWAKMKDMIQTRNSFKKKHRLSAHSDDIQIDVELCSDNEDNVFEDDENKSSLQVQNLSPGAQVYRRLDSSEVPPEIVARYQRMVTEEGIVAENSEPKKVSKWTRVKKAFLAPGETYENTTPYQLQKDCHRTEDDGKSVQAEIQRSYKQLQKKLSLEFQEKLSEWERMKQNYPGTSNPSSSCGFIDESKDPAFIKKMEEWQKFKSQPSVKNRPNIQMTSEEHLPPEFRKKLQEWEKIRKSSGRETSTKKKLGEVPRWKSLSGHRTENSPAFEYPPLSDDFRKKLEEWKQIRSGGNEEMEKKTKDAARTPSPRLSRKNSSPKHSKKRKYVHDKELQWFEKELGKIEKEKQRLERERQKFLEREERLSKLRNSVIGGLKKEVLIHTSSGFYRFEGISRKFKQKLYEWEKAQGIAPESSTFALLNSSLIQDSGPNARHSSAGNTPPLVRSKSADSIAISALNLTCPLMSHQPSSLSLNDVENLEKECLADSKSSSMQFMNHSHETLAMDEPEALIIEVEDIVEETAAPLRTYTQKTQQPVYQRQELKAMCEGETCAAPKVRRSESARAQNNYNLIEEIFSILKNLTENELEIQKTQDSINDRTNKSENTSDLLKLKAYDESQRAMSNRLVDKVVRLQEANSSVFTAKEDSDCSAGYANDLLETIQDLSSEVSQLAEKLDSEINDRNVYEIFHEVGARSLTTTVEVIKDIRSKMLELRRRLTYMCAASDLTAPRHKFENRKMNVRKTLSNESQESRNNNSDASRTGSDKASREGRLYIKSDTSNAQSQGAIKKRIKFRQKSLQNRSIQDTDDEEEGIEVKRNTHKKLTRTRSISESSISKVDQKKTEDEVIVDESLIQKVVVPTKTNFVSISSTPEDNVMEKNLDSPVTVFVKTTRKLFTPIIEARAAATSNKHEQEVNLVEDTTEVKSEIRSTKSKKLPEITVQDKIVEGLQREDKAENSPSDTVTAIALKGANSTPVTRLPPLPVSPTPQRKMGKDISPSIRLMLAKYNQKISEQDSPSGKSGGSSGSASPVAWRSPKAERRVRAQTERYQEGLTKLSPLLGARREVQKSASVTHINAGSKSVSMRRDSVQLDSSIAEQPDQVITKSWSTTVLGKPEGQTNRHRENDCERRASSLKLSIPTDSSEAFPSRHSPEIRLKKLQKAKEDFLKSSPPTSASTGGSIRFPSRNRLSQISVDSESSYDSACAGALIKSASAGMINIDADVYKQIDPEVHGGGYVSLPRSTKKPLLGGKFAFSNIASKFRKVKMRRGKDKDKEKMNAVSTLCRQSLVVDINRSLSLEERRRNQMDSPVERQDEGESSSKSTSWIRRPKLFKK